MVRAFSDLFGNFLVPMKLGKNSVILGKSMTILGKNDAIFSKIGKVYPLNWDFSANLEWSGSIGNFFSQLGKNLVPKTGPSFVQRKSPDGLAYNRQKVFSCGNSLVYCLVVLRQ